MSRMKYVFPKHEVAHLWAAQAQDNARVGHGNFYFIGKTIFSYGSHFPIATILKDGETVLFTNRGYSSTTSGHKSVVRQACQHMTKVYACAVGSPYSLDNWQTNVLDFYDQIRAQLQITTEPRRHKTTKANAVECAKRIIKDAELYVNTVGMKWAPVINYTIDAKQVSNIRQLQAWIKGQALDIEGLFERETKDILREQKRLEKAKKERQEMADNLLSLWKERKPYINPETGQGATIRTQDLYDTSHVGLRVSEDKEDVETSMGARVTVKEAELFYKRYIKPCKSVKGVKIGYYIANSLSCDERLLKIGCHTIDLDEVERLATFQGWN